MSLNPENFQAAKDRAIRYSENRRRKLAARRFKPSEPPKSARTTLSRSKPSLRSPGKQGLGVSGTAKGRKRLNPRGKKVKAWENARRKLKKRFEAAGITTCEFRFRLHHDCRIDDYLSFAHSRKRNDPEFIMDEVALACLPVHTILDEKMSHDEMYRAVRKAIEARKVRLT
jgi:hypothetical protein